MLADKVLDVANVAAWALVFGQFLGDRFSMTMAVVGMGLWGFLVVCALALAGGQER